MEIVFVLGCLIVIAVALWIVAGIRLVNWSRGKAKLSFWVNLLCVFAAITLLWMVIVMPTRGCVGFLCGLDEFILFILLSIATSIAWPIVLIFYANKKYPNKGRVTRAEEEAILDKEF